MRFDHAVIAVRDLNDAISRFRKLGFETTSGGRHEGLGTHNAIVQFGLDYVELLGVHDQALAMRASPNRQALVQFLTHQTGAIGFALATDDLESVVRRLARSGMPSTPPLAMRRDRPDGTSLTWRVVIPEGVAWRRPWPFFIQWDAPDVDRLDPQEARFHANGAVDVAGLSIVVQNLDKAVHLYRRLDLEVDPLSDDGGTWPRRAVVRIGPFEIELVDSTESAVTRDTLARQGEGLFEIKLRSKDLAQTHAFLSSTSVGLAERTAFGSRIDLDASLALGARLSFVE